MFSGSHSISRPGVTLFWVSNKIDLTRFLTIDIGDDKSDHPLEPGITMLFESGVHLSSTLSIKLFHKLDALYTKLYSWSLELVLGIIITRLVAL